MSAVSAAVDAVSTSQTSIYTSIFLRFSAEFNEMGLNYELF